MKIIKKIKVGVAFAMLAALVFTTTVNARSGYVQKEKYANDTSFYHPKNQEDKINYMLNECRVTLNNIDGMYGNGNLLQHARKDIKNGEYVFDCRLMANKLNFGLYSETGYIFNQGYMATDNPRNPRYTTYRVRCDEEDFWDIVRRCVDFDTWEIDYNKDDQFYEYSVQLPNIYYSLSYNGKTGILYAKNVFNK